MSTKISDLNIPMMGSVENARLLKWFVEEGAAFSRGDVLYELETDKTVTEVEADEDGILVRRLADEGDEFKMGDRVGLQAPPGTPTEEIEQALSVRDGKSAPKGVEEAASGAAVPAPVAELPDTSIPVKSSPRSRKLAREHDIDITTVAGTGPRGRVTGDDVLRAVANRDREGSAAESEAARVEAPPPSGAKAFHTPGTAGGASVPHTLRRKTIARNLANTMREAPHLTADMDIDLTSLMDLRKRYKESGQTPPSILAYFASTTARLLMDHRQLNATFREDDMLLWNTVNLNIGVDTEQGLVVPVIRDAQLLTASEMALKIGDAADRARSGELTADEMAGGTFTISNPGSIGPVVRAEAVLNGPQVALLGMPGIVNKPVAVEMPDGSYAIQVRPIIRVGVTFDHRALDGGPVIRFLNALKSTMETIGR